MHEVQVEVLETKVLQGVLDGELDVFGVVVELEELGGDKDLLAGDARVLDTLSDLGLVTVSPGTAVQSALALECLAHVVRACWIWVPTQCACSRSEESVSASCVRFLSDLP